jgi:hypothetical protein
MATFFLLFIQKIIGTNLAGLFYINACCAVGYAGAAAGPAQPFGSQRLI